MVFLIGLHTNIFDTFSFFGSLVSESKAKKVARFKKSNRLMLEQKESLVLRLLAFSFVKNDS